MYNTMPTRPCFDDLFPGYNTEPIIAYANDPDFATQGAYSKYAPDGVELRSARRRGSLWPYDRPCRPESCLRGRVSHTVPAGIVGFRWRGRSVLRNLEKATSYDSHWLFLSRPENLRAKQKPIRGASVRDALKLTAYLDEWIYDHEPSERISSFSSSAVHLFSITHENGSGGFSI